MPPIRSGVSGDVVTAVSTVVEEEESRCRQVSCLSDTDHLANCGPGRRAVVVVALLAQLCVCSLGLEVFWKYSCPSHPYLPPPALGRKPATCC